MKTTVLIALLMGSACVPALCADKPSDLIARGQTAEKNGDIAGARSAYTAALQADPSNPDARYALSTLNEQAGKIAARARVKELSEIQIPQVDFDKVTLKEALEALSMMTEKASGEKKYAPNFMVQDPAGKLDSQTLTLKVKGVPAKVVLEMVLAQVGGKARYDEHAVVITPAGG